jgi:hypothetical protein
MSLFSCNCFIISFRYTENILSLNVQNSEGVKISSLVIEHEVSIHDPSQFNPSHILTSVSPKIHFNTRKSQKVP